MIQTLRIALAQINTTVGDIAGNSELIARCTQQAREQGADLVAFPELAITGYPPEDLLLKPRFLDDNRECLDQLAALSQDITMVVGFVDVDEDIYNAAAVLHDGAVRGVYRKMFLPNYGVFDEERYFQHGHEGQLYELGGAGIGVNICEDIWYPSGPTGIEAVGGAELVVNISASPYRRGAPAYRERMLATRAQDHSLYVCWLNSVGGQDELVFDGSSAIFDAGGNVVSRAPAFQEALLLADLDVESVFRRRLHDPRGRKLDLQYRTSQPLKVIHLGPPVGASEKQNLPRPMLEAPLQETAEIYAALRLGVRDYVRKTGFEKVIIGLSGGVDSSLVATLASDALGPENVLGVSMPSEY
ncbi:MAG: NAD+ synthase, partial [Chloroflexota bacterium]|nr:NAD+ synthase [Chloroflexota bacterium]